MKSKGLGDTVHKAAKFTRIDKAVRAIMGAGDCGCEERRKILNEFFPYASDNK